MFVSIFTSFYLPCVILFDTVIKIWSFHRVRVVIRVRVGSRLGLGLTLGLEFRVGSRLGLDFRVRAQG